MATRAVWRLVRDGFNLQHTEVDVIPESSVSIWFSKYPMVDCYISIYGEIGPFQPEMAQFPIGKHHPAAGTASA
jgi:hypothetical protein